MRTKTYYRTCKYCGSNLDPSERCDCQERKEGERMAMTDAAREARNAYKREWYRKNPDKRKEYQERYWQKKTDSDGQKSAENGRKEGEPK